MGCRESTWVQQRQGTAGCQWSEDVQRAGDGCQQDRAATSSPLFPSVCAKIIFYFPVRQFPSNFLLHPAAGLFLQRDDGSLSRFVFNSEDGSIGEMVRGIFYRALLCPINKQGIAFLQPTSRDEVKNSLRPSYLFLFSSVLKAPHSRGALQSLGRLWDGGMDGCPWPKQYRL